MATFLRAAAISLVAFTCAGCHALPLAAAGAVYQNPLGYKTLDIAVTDADTGEPVPRVQIFTSYSHAWGPEPKDDRAETDGQGRARVRVWDGNAYSLEYAATGYVERPVSVRRVPEPDGRDVHVVLAKPIVIDVQLVLPEKWTGAVQVVEGVPLDPPAPGLRAAIHPKEVSISVEWGESVSPPGEADPIARMHIPTITPRGEEPGVTYRVTKARREGGGRVPVYRDVPPPDGGTGLYLIGKSAFENSVFLLGSLSDAMDAERAYHRFQWRRTGSSRAPMPDATP